MRIPKPRSRRPRRERGGLEAMPLEPAFLFSHELLQNALPELLSQTGTTGRQFAQLLIRVWQETRHNNFPDIERAAEECGKRQMPLTLDALLEICKSHGLEDPLVRRRRPQAERRAGALAIRGAGHRAHQRASAQPGRAAQVRACVLRRPQDSAQRRRSHFAAQRRARRRWGQRRPRAAGMGAQDVLYAWRDFECSFFAGALLCPRLPFRRFLIREAHRVSACHKLGVTPALVMRRMTAVSPYRHWHFFDAYAPGYLRAVYRANGIPLPWGNMSLVSDPCPRWAVFRLLQQTSCAAAASRSRRSPSCRTASARACTAVIRC